MVHKGFSYPLHVF